MNKISAPLEILFSLIEEGHFQAAQDILPLIRSSLDPDSSESIEDTHEQPEPLATEEE
jgi:hypothetical protein